MPIVYGLATYDAFEAVERGEFVLGGCEIIEGETPAWKCSNPECGLEFGLVASG